jgi:sugar-specific transcriptional regulator TrmB
MSMAGTSRLREIAGLNKYEELAYIALVEKGASTSPEVSRASGVPYGAIYPVLSSLESKGFVKTYKGKPKRFIAINPRIVFQGIVERRARELKESERELKGILATLERKGKVRPSEPIEAVQVIEGRKNYLNFSARLHEKARREWRSIHGFPVYKPHMDAYRKMAGRGVAVKVIAPVEREGTRRHKVWEKAGFRIRFSSKIVSRYSVIDDTDVVLRVRDMIPGKYTAVWIQSPAVAKTLISNFERLWKEAS